jgi:hypothetical protein
VTLAEARAQRMVAKAGIPLRRLTSGRLGRPAGQLPSREQRTHVTDLLIAVRSPTAP